MNHPLMLILMTGAGIYCAGLWLADLRARALQIGMPLNRENQNYAGAGDGKTTEKALPLPGAEPAALSAVVVAVAGALLILAVETWGEFALGLSAQQSRMTALFAVYSVVAAPVIEEIIFRGFLVVGSRRRAVVWAGALAASVVFAGLHPFLWRWDEAGLGWTLAAKGWFSTAAVLATSLWLYAARLGPWNRTASLLPCLAAHAAKNLGVVAIKGALGFLGGWW